MADGVSLSIISGPTLRAMRQLQAEVQKANVVAVRAAGKALAVEAKTRAPVYKGNRADVPKGRLRKSIKAGRAYRINATAAGILVGPRGYRASLYAGKAEASHPYMAPAEAATAATIATIAATAYAEAMARGSR